MILGKYFGASFFALQRRTTRIAAMNATKIIAVASAIIIIIFSKLVEFCVLGFCRSFLEKKGCTDMCACVVFTVAIALVIVELDAVVACETWLTLRQGWYLSGTEQLLCNDSWFQSSSLNIRPRRLGGSLHSMSNFFRGLFGNFELSFL